MQLRSDSIPGVLIPGTLAGSALGLLFSSYALPIWDVAIWGEAYISISLVIGGSLFGLVVGFMVDADDQ